MDESNCAITIEDGLQAYFNQPDGNSRPGVDWAIRIAGNHDATLIVRTYFSSDPPQETEKQALAEKAIRFIQTKLGQGWVPQPGMLEAD